MFPNYIPMYFIIFTFFIQLSQQVFLESLINIASYSSEVTSLAEIILRTLLLKFLFSGHYLLPVVSSRLQETKTKPFGIFSPSFNFHVSGNELQMFQIPRYLTLIHSLFFFVILGVLVNIIFAKI